ncbi:MAG: hypothetical protein WD063_00030 [Pirellulales bacterium]
MSRFAALFSCCVIPWAALSLYTACLPAAEPPAAEDPFGEPAAAKPAPASPFAVARSAPSQENPTPHLEARIRTALDHPTEIAFIQTPLQDAIDYLKDFHGIEIQLDARALEDAGIGSDSPVTRTLKGVSLASALGLVLRDLDLTSVVHHGVLLITTRDAAEKMVELRVYNIELVGSEADAARLAGLLESLFTTASFSRRQAPAADRSDSEAGTAATAGPTPRPAASGFDALSYRNLLIVQASQHDHEELTRLLGEIIAKLKTGQ